MFLTCILPPRVVALASVLVVLIASAVCAANPSYSMKVEIDTVPFFPNGIYDERIPKPDDILSGPVGVRPIRYHELVSYLKAVAEQSDRVLLEVYGRTHEGRDLYNVLISTPANLADLEPFCRRLDLLSDSRLGENDFEADSLIDNLPAFAWMGYGVHGGELSGVDAAVQLVYQLAAGTDSATMTILENTIVIVDPVQNPDGRERSLSMLATFRSAVPNYDQHAMQHGGVWPWGRANHYLFDLNRDWILATQPETIGRLRTLLKYHPQLVVDGHEMGSNATFLFDPPREPINYNITVNVRRWWKVFSDDLAEAFDRRGWPYYVQEWHDQWYPGYGSAWSTFSGTVSMLYEQAGVDGSIVRQRDSYLLTYHEAVNHQFTSSIANLATLAGNRREILRDYYQTRKGIVDDGRRQPLTFIFRPDGDDLKMQRFISSLLEQGIEVRVTTDDGKVRGAVGIDGREHHSRLLPVGTYLVSTAQPMGRLAKAVLEFDPHLDLDFLKEERRELEKRGETRMYEVSAWSLPLAYDIDAYQVTSALSVASETVQLPLPEPTGSLHSPDARFGFVIDMVGERTHRLLTRLFAEELIIYCAKKPFTVERREYKAGSLFLRRRGNPENLPHILGALAGEVGIDIYGVNTGRTTDGAYLGAPSYVLLRQPRVAVVAGDGIDYTSFGSLWFALDKELGLPHSLLQLSRLLRTDLSAYNVLVVPSAGGDGLTQNLGKQGRDKLETWIRGGGTLICIGRSAVWAADTATGLSQTRLRCQVLDRQDKYATGLQRELLAEAPDIDTMALWHPDKVPPPEKDEADQTTPPVGAKKAEELDEWRRRFHPRGVIMRADLDLEEWLAYGIGTQLPVMVYTRHALMATSPVKTVARFTQEKNKLRLSGLLWPEARERWAGTAYVTREPRGKGQIILFATDPYPRAYFWGTRRMFVNAVLLGPGMGSPGEPYGTR